MLNVECRDLQKIKEIVPLDFTSTRLFASILDTGRGKQQLIIHNP